MCFFRQFFSLFLTRIVSSVFGTTFTLLIFSFCFTFQIPATDDHQLSPNNHPLPSSSYPIPLIRYPSSLYLQADVLCRKDKWSPARDLMQYARNAKGAMQPAVYEKGRKVGGGCPGMNPWHDGWKLHKLKGSILVGLGCCCSLLT